MAPSRGFEEITIRPLGHQSGRDRFPRDYVTDNDIEIPRCAAWGMNLTALSQIYNMYLVAYGDKIHIYKPTGPQQLLSTKPLLILDIPTTPQALRIQHDDLFSSHSINHLIVGNLGTQEILLCACADGDVVAYYTAPIHRAMKSSSKPLSSRPTAASPAPSPFFHENVGISAWGLAIHSRSRLLAVSSNRHEVQVFAFALTSNETITSPLPSPPQTFPELVLPPSPSPSPPPSSSLPPRLHIPASPPTAPPRPPRTSNFRLRLPLGPEGDNIPSIAFSNDPAGEATTIIASDIRGALWFLPLWWRPASSSSSSAAAAGATRIPTVPHGVNVERTPQGWGVLVLEERFFKPVGSECEAFGCGEGVRVVRGEGGDGNGNGNGNRDGEGGVEEWDISASVGEVRDSNVWQREGGGANELAIVLGVGEMDDDDDGDEDNDEDNDEDDGEDEDEDGDFADNVLELDDLDDLVNFNYDDADDDDEDEEEEEEEEEQDFDDDFNESDISDDSDSDESELQPIDHHSPPSPPAIFPAIFAPSPSPPPSPPTKQLPPLPIPPHHILIHANRHTLTLYPPSSPTTLYPPSPTTTASPPHTHPHTPTRTRTHTHPLTRCTNLLRQDVSHAPPRRFGYAMEVYNRLNMLVGIPGVSVVLVGSQVGRVGVVRVVRGVGGVGGNIGEGEGSGGGIGGGGMGMGTGMGIPHGAPTMRIDAIIPFASQEGPSGPRPTTGLLGVAVSPMPGCGGDGEVEGDVEDDVDVDVDGDINEEEEEDEERVKRKGKGKEKSNESAATEPTGSTTTKPSTKPKPTKPTKTKTKTERKRKTKRKTKRGVKRWRIMLHYWDLSVLSYVLSDERALGVEGF